MEQKQKELMYVLITVSLLIVGIILWLEFDVWLDLKFTKINLATEELIATIAIVSYLYIWLRFVDKGERHMAHAAHKPASKRSRHKK